MGNMIFNGFSIKDYGIVVQTFPTYEYPENSYEMLHIDGKNGDFILDKKSFKNVDRTYYLAAAINLGSTFSKNVNKLISSFKSVNGYGRLEDSYEPEYFRLATFKDSGEVKNALNEAYTLEAIFECKPQRFLKSGEVSKEQLYPMSGSNIIINNPTKFISEPLIEFEIDPSSVIGNNALLEIDHIVNGEPVATTDIILDKTLTSGVIDSEIKDCLNYESGIAYINNRVELTNGFPLLYPGKNTIHVNSTGFTKIKITPRWWTL